MTFAIPAALATALTIASTVIGVGGAIYSAVGAANASNYQAQVDEKNAATAQENARRAEFAGQVAQQDQDAQTAAIVGQQLAEQSASGLSVNSRSSMLTRKTATILGRQDALNVRQAADLTATNFKTQSEDSAASAAFARMTAQNSLVSGFFNAGSSLIGGLTKLQQPQTTLLGQTKVPAPTRAVFG